MEEQNDKVMPELTRASIHNINTIRKWTLFLSILGFIMIGFLVVFGFSFGFIIEKIGGDIGAPFPYFIMGFIYLAIGVVYFFPILYLYRFSTNARNSIEENDTDKLTKAFKYLKDHYVYMGILFALATGLYVLSMIVLGIVALLM